MTPSYGGYFLRRGDRLGAWTIPSPRRIEVDYYFSGVDADRELNLLLSAGIRNILVDPYQYRRVIQPALAACRSNPKVTIHECMQAFQVKG